MRAGAIRDLAIRWLRAFPAKHLGTAAIALVAAVFVNYGVAHARWLTLLTSAGLILLNWRFAMEARDALVQAGSSRALIRGLVVTSIAWTVVMIGPLLVSYPPALLRANIVLGGLSFAYAIVALAAPRWLAARTRPRR